MSLYFVGLLLTIGFVDLPEPAKNEKTIYKFFQAGGTVLLLVVAWPLILGAEIRKVLK